VRAERNVGQLLRNLDDAQGKRTDVVRSSQVDERQTGGELGV
jgi:hypothetical protein